MIHPEEFIPIAEMGDQIRDLTLYVLNESAQQWQAWRDAGFSHDVSVNLSTRVLMDKAFVADVRRILQAHGVPGENVHFEITESAMLTDPARAIETITDLNSARHLLLDRRLRHRVLVAFVPQAAAAREPQDRPLVHIADADERARHLDRALDDSPRA